MQSTFERFAQTRVYRLLFALALTLACLLALGETAGVSWTVRRCGAAPLG
jgi:hypothetical protein